VTGISSSTYWVWFEEEEEDEELNSNAENYWKCPECGETVEIDFDVCWNCQKPKPDKVEQPDIEKIIQYQSDEEITLNAENFWKCPKCGETIESNFDTCWNCLNPKAETIEKPSYKEIVNYQSYKEQPSLVKSGFLTIGAGIVVLAFSGLTPISEVFGFERTYYGRFLFGIFFIIAGIFLLILGFSRKD